jgi:hypothetical protein
VFAALRYAPEHRTLQVAALAHRIPRTKSHRLVGAKGLVSLAAGD